MSQEKDFSQTENSIPASVEPGPHQNHNFCFTVGIGASAGGLEALENFFRNMPSESGMAFVVVQHLSPDYKSLMMELLSKHTEMQVKQVTEATRVEPNNVYLIPPKKIMTIKSGVLYLSEKKQEYAPNFPIDIFLHSLAEDIAEKAIGIILSGTGSDGTRGIRAIKEEGGMVMVQEIQTAKFDGMPQNAIATGLADYILGPDKMPNELLKYIKHPFISQNKSVSADHIKEDILGEIFTALKNATGLDFTFYKQNTILRRIERRMSVNQIEKLEQYIDYLKQNPNEVSILNADLLIGVTRFFRDAEAFDLMANQVIPEIYLAKSPGEQVRIWCSGCSTGEEAYSLAILCREYMERTGVQNELKIFATDVDNRALEIASTGIYPENIAADLSRERLKNYFIRENEKYQIRKNVRELVIFAPQNLIKDPPFNKIDLISCRNLLIYLQPVLQQRILNGFNFSLNENGFLFLGSSETVGNFTNLFTPFNNKWKIYKSRGRKTPLDMQNYFSGTISKNRSKVQMAASMPKQNPSEKKQVIDDIYAQKIKPLVPPTVIVNNDLQIVRTYGDVNDFFRLQEGEFSANIARFIRKDISIAVEIAIQKCMREKQDIVYNDVKFNTEDETRRTTIRISPFVDHSTQENFAVVSFLNSMAGDSAQGDYFEISRESDARIRDLENELQYTKENLQATIEELETTNEELHATNEELLSSNEELQSTNEELQSVNEELITVNSEYQSKINELTDLNNDMDNYLTSTHVGIIFLDRELRVRKFTPQISDAVNLVDADIGRPITHIAFTLDYQDIVSDAEEVIRTLVPVEKETRTKNGKWLLARILPYRTDDNSIDGVVMSFVNITKLKQTEEERLANERKYRTLANNFPNGGVLLFDENLNILLADGLGINEAGFSKHEIEGMPLASVLSRETASLLIPRLEKALQGYKGCFELRFKDRFYEANTMPVEEEESTGTANKQAGRWTKEIDKRQKNASCMLVFVDITERKKTEEELIWSKENLEKRVEARTAELQELNRKLSESENLYRTLMDNMADALFLIDLNGRFIDVNEVACRRLGYSREELLDMGPKEIYAKEYADHVDEIKDHIHKKGEEIFKTVMISRNNEMIPTEINARMIELNGKRVELSLARIIPEASVPDAKEF